MHKQPWLPPQWHRLFPRSSFIASAFLHPLPCNNTLFRAHVEPIRHLVVLTAYARPDPADQATSRVLSVIAGTIHSGPSHAAYSSTYSVHNTEFRLSSTWRRLGPANPKVPDWPRSRAPARPLVVWIIVLFGHVHCADIATGTDLCVYSRASSRRSR